MSRRSHAAGFTLIEILAAMLIGVLLLGAIDRVAGITARLSGDLARTRETNDRRRNAERWLRSAIESIDTGSPGAAAFDGGPTRLRCSALRPDENGWFQRAVVDLGVSDGQLVLAEGERRIVLADSVEAFEIDYLLEPGANTRWVRSWSSPTSAPLALRARIYRHGAGAATAADTLLLVIGERG